MRHRFIALGREDEARGEPGGIVADDRLAQLEDCPDPPVDEAVAGVAAVDLADDVTAPTEAGEVTRDPPLGDPELLDELADRPRPLAEALEDPDPGRVGEALEERGEGGLAGEGSAAPGGGGEVARAGGHGRVGGLRHVYTVASMSRLGNRRPAAPGPGTIAVMATTYGAVEAGGTKVLCLVGSGPDEVRRSIRIPTGEPQPTLRAVVDFFRAALAEGEPIRAIGVGSFGPLELRPDAPAYGRILRTPKPGWSGVDIVGALRQGLGLPIGLETDVNAAALGEGRWGAARDCRAFVYVTVGTGIGGGAVVDGRLVGGLGHPEMGHLPLPRIPGDDFEGTCRYHRDCWEGLACGPALEARFGRRPEAFSRAEVAAAVRLEAAYLALGLRALVYALAPERIVLGGGVAELPGLLEATRAELVETLGGYPGLEEHGGQAFLVRPGLGGRAGVLGALVVAERAAAEAG